MGQHSRLNQTEKTRLAKEAVRLRKQARGTPPGVERERLIRRARLAEDAVQHMTEWLKRLDSNQRPKH